MVTVIVACMVIYEVYKLVSPEWELQQRALAVEVHQMQQEGKGSIVEYMTPDLARYIIINMMYIMGEVLLVLSFQPKYMVAAIAIHSLSKFINKYNKVMDSTLIRVDSMATLGILALAIIV